MLIFRSFLGSVYIVQLQYVWDWSCLLNLCVQYTVQKLSICYVHFFLYKCTLHGLWWTYVCDLYSSHHFFSLLSSFGGKEKLCVEKNHCTAFFPLWQFSFSDFCGLCFFYIAKLLWISELFLMLCLSSVSIQIVYTEIAVKQQRQHVVINIFTITWNCQSEHTVFALIHFFSHDVVHHSLSNTEWSFDIPDVCMDGVLSGPIKWSVDWQIMCW